MITLTSDFQSPYPAAMKGVVLQESDARLVDVAHDLPRQDVRTAAFWLREILPYFPAAVHLIVVDPGVGTDRAAIAIRAGGHALVGPDNGVLLPVAQALADGGFEVFEIAASDPDSTTFHGRDVFAPAAATIHEVGISAFHDHEKFSPADSVVDLTFPDAELDDDTAEGEVLVVDGFGNAITNIPGSFLDGRYGDDATVSVGTAENGGEEDDEGTTDAATAPVRRTYAIVADGKRLVTVGSHGNVELAVNQGRGVDAFDVNPGDSVTLSF
jgi:S-adenosylmethionine hydrolase